MHKNLLYDALITVLRTSWFVVMPEQSGIHTLAPEWIPEYSGMTIVKVYGRGKLALKDECFWPNSCRLADIMHSK